MTLHQRLEDPQVLEPARTHTTVSHRTDAYNDVDTVEG